MINLDPEEGNEEYADRVLSKLWKRKGHHKDDIGFGSDRPSKLNKYKK